MFLEATACCEPEHPVGHRDAGERGSIEQSVERHMPEQTPITAYDTLAAHRVAVMNNGRKAGERGGPAPLICPSSGISTISIEPATRLTNSSLIQKNKH